MKAHAAADCRPPETPADAPLRRSLPGGWRWVEGSALHAVARSAWHDMLCSLVDDASRLPGYELLKYGPTAEVVRVQPVIDGAACDLIAKRARESGITARLRLSRAERNLRRAIRLLRAGVATPEVYAVAVRRRATVESWLVTSTIAEAMDLDAIALSVLPALSAAAARRLKTCLIEAIVRTFIALETAGLRHRDLKASNLLITGFRTPDPCPTVWLVDLDGLSRAPALLRFSMGGPGSGFRWQPLVRLAASLHTHPAVTRTDFLRFLYAWLRARQVPADAPQWKKVWHRLAKAVHRYHARAQTRKHGKIDGYTADEPANSTLK